MKRKNTKQTCVVFLFLSLFVFPGCYFGPPSPESDVPVRSSPGKLSAQKGIEINELKVNVVHPAHILFHSNALVRFRLAGTITAEPTKYPSIKFVQYTNRLKEIDSNSSVGGDLLLVPFKRTIKRSDYDGEERRFSIKIERLVDRYLGMIPAACHYRVRAGDQVEFFRLDANK